MNSRLLALIYAALGNVGLYAAANPVSEATKKTASVARVNSARREGKSMRERFFAQNVVEKTQAASAAGIKRLKRQQRNVMLAERGAFHLASNKAQEFEIQKYAPRVSA